MIKVFRKAILFLTIAAVGVAIASAFWVRHYLQQPLLITETSYYYHLANGATLSGLSHDLANQGLIKHPQVLTLWGRVSGKDRQIRAGEYQFEQGLTLAGLLEQLTKGQVVAYQVMLLEGKTFNEVLSDLHQQEKLTKHLSGLNETQILEKLGLANEYRKLEGLFFPDTYRYRLGDSDIQVLQRAQRRLRDVLDKEWQIRADKLPYKSAYDALIMASIVEKETGLASERPMISGVFVRRLQKGMRLQTDPTVIYGLGDAYRGNLRRRHLKEPSPYNTYLIRGLPPTPIALVGEAAIHAALHPASGSSLYFVARGDGSHYFSDTLAEHQKAVQRYQVKMRSKNYHSAPDLGAKSASQHTQKTEKL